MRGFRVLALESSADDTCAAVVTSQKEILSNVVVKQHTSHEEWGGIHPLVAVKSHQKNMPGAIRKALDDAKCTIDDIDGIAFTRGPGMRSCLAVCADAAKALAAVLNKPLVGVHHMQAHALTAQLTSKESLEFPFLTLLISGGHTNLLLATTATSFHMLANTVDISIGRAFDRVARDLNLPWSESPSSVPIGAGPMLEVVANLHQIPSPTKSPSFPVPMGGVLSFSYGGLLSAVQRHIQTLDPSSRNYTIPNSSRSSASRPGISIDPPPHIPNTPSNAPPEDRYVFHPEVVATAAAFQYAAVLQLEKKLGLALKLCEDRGIEVKTVVASGGVASNRYLRSRLQAFLRTKDITIQYPPISLCTDNAVMIGWASMHRFLNNDTDPYEIDLLPKWPLEALRAPEEPGIFDTTTSS